jgi:hypothetical protein
MRSVKHTFRQGVWQKVIHNWMLAKGWRKVMAVFGNIGQIYLLPVGERLAKGPMTRVYNIPFAKGIYIPCWRKVI